MRRPKANYDKPPDTFKGSEDEWYALPRNKKYNVVHAVKIAAKTKAYKDKTRVKKAWSSKVTSKQPATYQGSLEDWQALSPQKRHGIVHGVQLVAKRKIYNAKNKNRDRATERLRVAKNPEKYAAGQKKSQVKYALAHPEKKKALTKAWYDNNSQAISIKRQQRRIEKNKEFREMFGEDGIQP